MVKQFTKLSKRVPPPVAVVRNIKMVYDAKLAHVAWGKVPARSRTMISIERVGVPLTQAIRTGKILVGDACAHIRLAIDELLSIGLAHWDVRVDACFYDERMRVAFLDDLEYLTELALPPPHNIWGPLPLPSTASALDESQYGELVWILNAM